MSWQEAFRALCDAKDRRARYRVVDTVFFATPSSWVSTTADGTLVCVELTSARSTEIRASFLRQAGVERPGSGMRPGSSGASAAGKSPRRSNTFRNVAVAWVGPPHERERRDLNERTLDSIVDGIGARSFGGDSVEVHSDIIALQPFLMPRRPGTVYHTVLVQHEDVGAPSVYVRRVRFDVSTAKPEALPAAEQDIKGALTICAADVARSLTRPSRSVARLSLEFVVDANRELWLARVVDLQYEGDDDVEQPPQPPPGAPPRTAAAAKPGSAASDSRAVAALQKQLYRAQQSESDLTEALKRKTKRAAASAARLQEVLQRAKTEEAAAEPLRRKLKSECDTARATRRELAAANEQIRVRTADHTAATAALQAQLDALTLLSLQTRDTHGDSAAVRETLRQVEADALVAREVATSARQSAAREASAAASAARRLVDSEAERDEAQVAYASCERELANARSALATATSSAASERAAREGGDSEANAALQGKAMRALQQQLRDALRASARDARKVQAVQKVAGNASAAAARSRASEQRAVTALRVVKEEHAVLVRKEEEAAQLAARTPVHVSAPPRLPSLSAADALRSCASSAVLASASAATAAMSMSLSATMVAFQAKAALDKETRTAYRESLLTVKGDASSLQGELRLALSSQTQLIEAARQSVLDEHMEEQRALRRAAHMIETAADATIKKMQRAHRQTQRAAAHEINELRMLLEERK